MRGGDCYRLSHSMPKQPTPDRSVGRDRIGPILKLGAIDKHKPLLRALRIADLHG